MILPATQAYACVMAAIHQAAFPSREGWDAATVATQLGLPGHFGLLHPQGGMLLARVIADEAEILTLAVAPAARRQGVARALLQAAMTHAASATKIFLEVSAANQPALALYDQAGFSEVGRRQRYYADGADALVLRADLSPCGSPGG